MRKLLKKLRWKWHRDIMELGFGELYAEIEKRDQWHSENTKIAAAPPSGDLDSFIFQTELAKVFSLLEDRESQK